MRFDEALASYDRALELRLDDAEVHSNRSVTLFELKRFAEALASGNRAIALRPDYPEAHANRGNA
jgi:Flp pilus assembly protein TadD